MNLFSKINTMIRFHKRKKYEYLELMSKMYYIMDFMNQKCKYKMIDPELDLMCPHIKKLAKSKYINGEITKKEYIDIISGIKYHKKINKEIKKGKNNDKIH